ncbi:MAG TPA: dihydropteroate synthase [Holophagaceae bacterium]|nr:dihydropteroate synthase [Holophagaceae bacterium]
MATFHWGPLLQGGPPSNACVDGDLGTLFIGILNLTPDSFSDGGRFTDPADALAQAHRLMAAGCRILDLGAESTRPGAVPIVPDEEWRRLEGPLALLRRELPGVPLSLDTRHAEVAAMGLAAGASVLNDVTGFCDPAMLALARASSCGLIAMRSRSRDGALVMPDYEGPGETTADRAVAELASLKDRLLDKELDAERLLLDPGFGFGTTFGEDLALWEALPALPGRLSWPADRICIGLSRKRFLARRAGTPGLAPAGRDGLTAQAQAQAHGLGYRVFRTHAATLEG